MGSWEGPYLECVSRAMEIQEMTEPECRAMLARRSVTRLACARNNHPYIVPIHLDLEGDSLYGYATLGQKIEWMRQNPFVCLEGDEITTHGQWASVIVFGQYEELPDRPEYAGARGVAERLFQRHPVWWEPAAVPLAAHDQRAPIVFRIRIGRMTGRRAAPDPVNTVQAREHAPEARGPRWLTQVLRRILGRRPVLCRRSSKLPLAVQHSQLMQIVPGSANGRRSLLT